MSFIIKNKYNLLAIGVGAEAGWLYFYYWGCSGSCAITSNPLNSSLYGAVMGILIVNIVRK